MGLLSQCFAPGIKSSTWNTTIYTNRLLDANFAAPAVESMPAKWQLSTDVISVKFVVHVDTGNSTCAEKPTVEIVGSFDGWQPISMSPGDAIGEYTVTAEVMPHLPFEFKFIRCGVWEEFDSVCGDGPHEEGHTCRRAGLITSVWDNQTHYTNRLLRSVAKGTVVTAVFEQLQAPQLQARSEKLWQSLPATFVINLANDTTRRQEMKEVGTLIPEWVHLTFDTFYAVQMLDRTGFRNYKFVNATQPRELESFRKKPARITTPAEFVSFKELGCALSHADAISQGLDAVDGMDRNDAFLVLEDDVTAYAEADVQEYILSALNESPSNFDVLYLGWCMEACELTQNISDHLQTAVGPLCAHAYAVSARGARKLLPRMVPASEPNDVVLRKMVVSGELNALKSRHIIFEQKKNLYIAAGDNGAALKELNSERPSHGTSPYGSSLNNPPTLMCHPLNEYATLTNPFVLEANRALIGFESTEQRLVGDIVRHRTTALSWLLTFGSAAELHEIAELGAQQLLPEAAKYSNDEADFLNECVGDDGPHCGSHGYVEWLRGYPDCWVQLFENQSNMSLQMQKSLTMQAMQDSPIMKAILPTRLADDSRTGTISPVPGFARGGSTPAKEQLRFGVGPNCTSPRQLPGRGAQFTVFRPWSSWGGSNSRSGVAPSWVSQAKPCALDPWDPGPCAPKVDTKLGNITGWTFSLGGPPSLIHHRLGVNASTPHTAVPKVASQDGPVDSYYGNDAGPGRASTPLVGVQSFMGQCVPIVYVGMAGTLPKGTTPVNTMGAEEGEWREGLWHHYFVALNGETGEFLWAYWPNCGTIEGGGSFGPDNTIIFQPWGCDVIAIDAVTGAKRWTSSGTGRNDGAGRNPGLLITESGLVVMNGNGQLKVVDATTGKTAWRSEGTASCDRVEADDGADCSNTLSSGSGKVYVPNYSNTTVSALDESSGDIVWQYTNHTMLSGEQCSTVSPQFVHIHTGFDKFDALFVHACQTLIILDASDGSVRETRDLRGCSALSPGVVTNDGQFYFTCDSLNELIYANADRWSSGDGRPEISRLNRYDAATNKMVWNVQNFVGLPGNVLGDIVSMMIALDEESQTLLVGGDSISAFNASSGKYLWTAANINANGWGSASPAVANGNIYVSNGTTATMLTNKQRHNALPPFIQG
eukprot:SAG31_NODE_813_length_11892_cov_5.354538_4_plen_1160_part_00